MRPHYRFLVMLVCLLDSVPAIASDWVAIAGSKDATTYVDKQSIKGDANSRECWLQRILKEDKIEGLGKWDIKIKEYWEINCNNHTIKIQEVNYYSSDGELVDNFSSSESDTLRITPDYVGEAVAKYVCSFKPAQ